MRRAEERCVPRALPAICMACGIPRKIGFRLDDPSRRDAVLAIANENASEQRARKRTRLDR